MSTSDKPLAFSIILPVYNKQNSIATVYQAIFSEIEKGLQIEHYEIIFVDDASTDNSISEIEKITDQRVKILNHARNQGQLKAIETALKVASGDVVAIYSCDTQNPFNTIPELYHAIRSGYELAIGYRAVRYDKGLNVLFSKIFYNIISFLDSRMPSGGFDFGMFNQRIRQELLKKDMSKIFLQLEVLELSIKTYYLNTQRNVDLNDSSSWELHLRFRYAVIGIKSTLNRFFK